MDTGRMLVPCALIILASAIQFARGRIAFEKVTNLDFAGTVYYTVRNVSLYECLGWCRDETECVAATFSFVVNPLTPVQETTCLLQNDTQAKKPGALLQRSINTYFLVKLHLRTEHVCNRLWAFERVPNKSLRGLQNAIIFTSNKESCLASCLSESRFPCRSVEFNYVTLECRLSEFDRRSPGVDGNMVDSKNVDYFENACLHANQMCRGLKNYAFAHVGLSQHAVTHFVRLNYYLDKQIVVSNRKECLEQCNVESEFLCRSVLYVAEPRTGKATCKLFHLDHIMFPDGAHTFTHKTHIPLLDSADTTGVYLEAVCANETVPHQHPTGKPSSSSVLRQPTNPSTSLFAEARDPACDDYGVCYDVSIQCTDTKITVNVRTNRPFHGRIYALGRSETCHANVLNSQQFRLDLPLSGQECNTQSLGGVYTNTVVLQHHNVVMTRTDKVYNVRCTYEIASRNISFGMMPIRDPDTMHVTSSPEAPIPKIIIFGPDKREATTVRIGDKLTFRIEIPNNTPYGIFARSCVAMAKDARSTFEVIDDRGCPLDPSLFPRFRQMGNALESSYDAFRFTESYGVIFQCNVKYCIGKCEPALCNHSLEKTESWGRKKRSQRLDRDANEMTLSRELLVLDYGNEAAYSKQEYSVPNNETFNLKESILFKENCASRASVMALSITSAVLLVLFVCTVAYFVGKRKTAKNFY